jgi:hypothetical protein
VERSGFGGFEAAIVIVGGLALAVVGVVWAGASLALLLSGREAGVAFAAAADAASRLPANVAAPASAWPAPYSEALPGAPAYWLSTGVCATGAVGLVAVGVRWFGRSKVGTSKRRPLGVDARPRFASRRDLRPLVVNRPTPGRFAIARFGRRLVATEAPRPA